MTRANPGFCKTGHPLDKQNTYVHPNGVLECKTCREARKGRYRGKYKYDRVTSFEARRRFKDTRLFGGNREAALARDGEKCVKCGMTRQEHRERYGLDINVDHIDLNGSGKPKHLKNNALENLQTLCIPCHITKDAELRRQLKEQSHVKP